MFLSGIIHIYWYNILKDTTAILFSPAGSLKRIAEAPKLSYRRTESLMIYNVSEKPTTHIVRQKGDDCTSELETAGLSEAVVTRLHGVIIKETII
jgi:hypothetical protein